jgi:hypothetical protein
MPPLIEMVSIWWFEMILRVIHYVVGYFNFITIDKSAYL